MIPSVPGDASAPEGETPRCLATPAHPRDPSLLRDLLRKTMSERRFVRRMRTVTCIRTLARAGTLLQP